MSIESPELNKEIKDVDIEGKEKLEGPEALLSEHEKDIDKALEERNINPEALKRKKWSALAYGSLSTAFMGVNAAMAFTRDQRGVTESLESINVNPNDGYFGLLGFAAIGAAISAVYNQEYKTANKKLKEASSEQEA